MALIRPGLLVYCPQKLIDGLPMPLRDWDKIEVSVDEANRWRPTVWSSRKAA